MSIPVGFVAPNLPVAVEQYDRSSEDRFINALRLYFGLLDNQNQVQEPVPWFLPPRR